jgi:integrase
MQDHDYGQVSINIRLAAIRKFSVEAVDLGIWPDSVATAFANVKNICCPGTRTGKWLTEEEAQQLINAPDCSTKAGLRDRAILSVGIGCGLRRTEFTTLDISHIQTREGGYVFANIVGKRNKTRTVTIPDWVMQTIEEYLEGTGISRGRLFRPMSRSGKILAEEINHYTIQKVVKRYGKKCGFKIAPHDLRRTYAKLSYKNGAKLQQIQLNLGHQSLTTTQKYLGAELDYSDSPGDYIKISFGEQGVFTNLIKGDENDEVI